MMSARAFVSKLLKAVPNAMLNVPEKSVSVVRPSSGLYEIEHAAFPEDINSNWQDPGIPDKQYEQFVRPALTGYRSGVDFEPFDVLVRIISENIPNVNELTLLEVGCSSGYYSEALNIKEISPQYIGCDSSEAFVALARKHYPSIEFHVEDACRLTFPASSFDIVVSGGCLPCILEYKQAITESARVAKDFVVFHRTPVFYYRKTGYYMRHAYDHELLEIHFNERELLRLWREAGLVLQDAISFEGHIDPSIGDFMGGKTYLCRKVG